MEKFKLGKKCFIVAEVSANHGRDFKRAVSSIRKAKECGADAVKFQTYTPDTLTLDADNKYFRIKHGKWAGQTLYQLYSKSYTPWRWFKRLKQVADSEGIVFFSTAFDRTAVDFLEELGAPLHKIASFELVDLPLIEYAARTSKPLMISTGMASLKEIKEAVGAAKQAGAKDIMLLKCVSDYPAEPKTMNLRTIPYMAKLFKLPVGLSDHTLGIATAVAAVAQGARIIEKHFILSRKMKTPDSFFSLEPPELKSLVENVRIAEEAMGEPGFKISRREERNKIFRRSLFCCVDISRGEVFTDKNVRSVRPGCGLQPRYQNKVIGRRAKKDIKKGTPLSWSLVSD